jgi:hypothetical protein
MWDILICHKITFYKNPGLEIPGLPSLSFGQGFKP